MCSPTVERSHIAVKSVGPHSLKQEIWKPTSAFTLEKSLISAHNVISQVSDPFLSNNTWPGIRQQLISFVLPKDDQDKKIDCPWLFSLIKNNNDSKARARSKTSTQSSQELLNWIMGCHHSFTKSNVPHICLGKGSKKSIFYRKKS